MYSAVKVDGVRLYKLARKGIEVERKPREVEIYELELIEKYGEDFGEKHGKDFGEECGELAILSETNGEMPYKFKLKIWCTSGTYVRVLIDDIGRELGFGAVMTDLVRTKSNGFEIENCVEISNLNRENIFGYINS
jgi:tRNA pseudouridine55 synthase